MLVKFSSVKTESLIMFGDTAVQLIKMLGATGAVPGGLSAEDIPQALIGLKQGLAALPSAPNESASDDDEAKRQPPPALATRAVPLIELLERAQHANATVMWESM